MRRNNNSCYLQKMYLRVIPLYSTVKVYYMKNTKQELGIYIIRLKSYENKIHYRIIRNSYVLDDSSNTDIGMEVKKSTYIIYFYDIRPSKILAR